MVVGVVQLVEAAPGVRGLDGGVVDPAVAAGLRLGVIVPPEALAIQFHHLLVLTLELGGVVCLVTTTYRAAILVEWTHLLITAKLLSRIKSPITTAYGRISSTLFSKVADFSITTYLKFHVENIFATTTSIIFCPLFVETSFTARELGAVE